MHLNEGSWGRRTFWLHFVTTEIKRCKNVERNLRQVEVGVQHTWYPLEFR